MAIPTYYSGPPDLGLGQITQGMLADEANRNAATANQAQFFATLAGQRAAERTARNRDASAERIATMPYNRMTQAQAAAAGLGERQQKFYEAHPELYGDSRMQLERSRQRFDLEAEERDAEAAASLANMLLDQYKENAKPELQKVLTSGWLWRGPEQDEAPNLIDKIIKGESITGSHAGTKWVKDAQDLFVKGLHDTTIKTLTQLGEASRLVRMDPATKRWVSVHAKTGKSPTTPDMGPGQGPPMPYGMPPGGVPTAPPPVVQPVPAAAIPPSAPWYNRVLPFVMKGGGGGTPPPAPAVVPPAGPPSAAPWWAPYPIRGLWADQAQAEADGVVMPGPAVNRTNRVWVYEDDGSITLK